MARKKDDPLKEISRKLAPRRDDRVADPQKAVQQQQKRDITKWMEKHKA